jgi:hypothetical protein
MCQFIVEDMIESRRIFVAPISRISFECGHPIKLPIKLQIDACQKRRVSGGSSQWKCDSSRRASHNAA